MITSGSNAQRPNSLEVTNLTKRYAKKTALSNVSFTVAQGESIALLGPNGAGKTTLLSCIIGSKYPTQGSVRVLGQDVTHNPSRTVSFVFDRLGLSTDFKAKHCIEWEVKAHGLPRETTENALDQFELRSFANSYVKKLSTGQRQRVAIAAALISDPELLILDEPDNGLDVEASLWLHDIVKERTARGRTNIISSHRIAHAMRMASRCVIINQTMKYDGVFPEAIDPEEWYLQKAHEEGT